MTILLGLARIERETVQERVYAALRDKLMRGGFEPGQKLKIADLAGALGTSAMPVRDALNRLAAERAVESLPNRGVRVPALSKASLQDLMEARFAVEGLAAERASIKISPAAISTLRGFVDTQSKTDDAHISEQSAEQNREFPYLRIASERFDGRHGRGIDFHVEIVAALERGDGAAARRALQSDIGRAFELVMHDHRLRPRLGVTP